MTNLRFRAYIKFKIDIQKGDEKEEYAQPLKRENGSPAERPFEERHAEGSFGTGKLKRDMEE